MMDAFAQLVPWIQANMYLGFVIFLRVGAAMALLPTFGEQSVPRQIRLGLALAFTVILAPIIGATDPALSNARPILGLYIATEVVIGLALGFMLRLFVIALQIAGSMAAQATSLSQIFAGAGVEPLPAIGHVLVVSGLALAVMMGLHLRIVEFFVLSYDLLPPGQFPARETLAQWGISRISYAFGLAFTLAAPFVIASLIYNVALGVINKAMPQLMVAFVGAPAITAGGLILLFLAAPLLLAVWTDALAGFLSDPFGAPR